MQTFLPYPGFAASAKVLDRQRLGKQRIETMQILRTLLGQRKGWANHPAVLMWRGHERQLAVYGVRICDEWLARGYRDTCRAKIIELGDLDPLAPTRAPGKRPTWLGDEQLHRAHRSLLLRKDPAWYGPRFSDTPADIEFIWPVVTSTEA